MRGLDLVEWHLYFFSQKVSRNIAVDLIPSPYLPCGGCCWCHWLSFWGLYSQCFCHQLLLFFLATLLKSGFSFRAFQVVELVMLDTYVVALIAFLSFVSFKTASIPLTALWTLHVGFMLKKLTSRPQLRAQTKIIEKNITHNITIN